MNNDLIKRLRDYAGNQVALKFIHEAADALESAQKRIAELEAGPKIKALEWKPFGNGKIARPNFAGFTTYTVQIGEVGDNLWYAQFGPTAAVKFTTFDEGISVCQADFERRVKECLLP